MSKRREAALLLGCYSLSPFDRHRPEPKRRICTEYTTLCSSMAIGSRLAICASIYRGGASIDGGQGRTSNEGHDRPDPTRPDATQGGGGVHVAARVGV